MTKEEILTALNLKSYDEALRRDMELDAKGHHCGFNDKEKEEVRLLKEYFNISQ